MIDFRPSGDIFSAAWHHADGTQAPADYLVCPVNCIPGVMGAGLAKAFAEWWPGLKGEHKRLGNTGLLVPGQVLWIHAEDHGRSGPGVVFFPTKDHFRHASELSYVYFGLARMALDIQEQDRLPDARSRVFALPALGCGLGGLRWYQVRPMIESFASVFPIHRFIAFEPHERGSA